MEKGILADMVSKFPLKRPAESTRKKQENFVNSIGVRPETL
jgi:hypothetical protein